MSKHKLIELQKIINEKIGSLKIGTNVKLNPLYIADRKDEIEFVRWIDGSGYQFNFESG